MSLFFVVGIYFYARGVFALFGQTIFYTKRTLELIEPENLPAYLKESGVWHMVAGTIFVGKALLDIMFPLNKVFLAMFLVLLAVCVYFLSRCNERYIKK
ncbi:hypothetical protein [Anaerotignum propionicum]|jgi:hypothetical protein|uniref:DUF3784 domain-containing protein n=1 Tax=Anaerotignum propionicum DSM 1682 TaxID=991789 RepID=A0A110A786_ANAPI|nr:hypothetical protein [Anaerotignum propionicum]AMJ40198.1 hypothetical protein CPRO_05950 [Anaerotignum propionicum DSM 1682]SHF10246.1 hypothetical protein SAMN02745151_02789 [[Clostridium] propionicum DSM 1682] [Anaerotignum propionicum DSM 1682]HBF65341.1 hypothetical protein [Clostridium sp.]